MAEELHDLQLLFQIMFSGDAIDPENNSNWAQLDDPEINEMIEEAEPDQRLQERLDAWGEVLQGRHGRGRGVPWSGTTSPMSGSLMLRRGSQSSTPVGNLSYTSLPEGRESTARLGPAPPPAPGPPRARPTTDMLRYIIRRLIWDGRPPGDRLGSRLHLFNVFPTAGHAATRFAPAAPPPRADRDHP